MCRPNFRNSNVLILALFAAIASLSAMADSHVRIVRLSYIEGGVQISRGPGGAYEKAIVNLPITEGAKLKTSDGRAEVEFEDGSTLRIVADSTVEFPQLSLRDSGAKVSEVKVTSGTAYVNFTGTKNDEFSIGFENKKIALDRAAHLRIILGDEDSSIAVFKGLVQVVSPSGTTDVKKNQTISFDLDSNQYKVAKNIQESPFDSWDDQQNEYHTRYAAKSYNSYSPYAYGTTDLSYYGNFFNAPSYGMLWQPYLAGIGWDPFMDGAWAFNSGSGFGWVSSYPWGWTPYHYGTWVFLPGYGWAWQPGGVWHPWYSQPVVRNAPKSFVPPHAPAGGTSTVVVNRGPASTFAGNKLMVRNNSAGLGVPRGQFGNMAKLSQKAQQRGVVSERVHMQPAVMPSGPTERRTGAPAGRAGMPSRASQPTRTSQPMPRSQPTPRMSAPSSSSSHAGRAPHR
jgi:FecR protein